MKKLVILDRDGVINLDSPNFIKSPEEWIPIPGSLEAIAKLNQAGYKVAIATNQSGIARGLFDLNTLDNIHQKMHQALSEKAGAVDAIFYCAHHPEDNCSCRKPKAGLLRKIAEHFKIDLGAEQIWCIGDSLRDLEAAEAVGANPVLVLTGNGKKTRAALQADDAVSTRIKNSLCYEDLSSAVTQLLEMT